ncbi:ABC-F family ATP-binding cassette domain-containing protein [Hymenobacter metallicola]|uniref:ABC-F family ATP-binding cassette domain-containing protein n=1 Tax=Hymenobacter metallicola TaxID=2563114 RepID=A0A4Z0QHQ0_9BACT|nr:ABC-F family ATP-binding cassette domain-containing protein [Hymenobacter metallicola]TGE28212.1 ABC-F family ATP-binding cassette domain-containing protein [Hymenobacter metallicola]
MVVLQNVGYAHPNKDVLFSGIHLSVTKQQKVALIGNNGVGKSTLLRIMAGGLPPASGVVKLDSPPYYVPQLVGQFNHLTVAQALGIAEQLQALHDILAGHATEANLALLDDDWTLEERSADALAQWGLAGLDLTQPVEALSGGQKTKLFLAGMTLHQPDIILLDEPSNHLDAPARRRLYEFIQATTSTLLVVSHDRTLLHLLDSVYELSRRGITVYGGNYAFYQEQKQLASNALQEDVRGKEKALRKAREVERETAERQQKLDARGRKKQEKAGVPTIMLNTLRNNAEKSTSRLQGVHAEKIGAISQELHELRQELPATDKMKFGFDSSGLHQGKILVTATGINFRYAETPLWAQDLSFQITSGERLALKGPNGAGKTTLIKLLLGAAAPASGTIHRALGKVVYVDQEYSLLATELTVYEQAQRFNGTALPEHEIKIRLSRFLFPKDDWSKSCRGLSGGEKMRLMLCCLTISSQAPDLIILDEPTNNLDIQNIEILTAALTDYRGTLLVVSHDQVFLEQIKVQRTLELL